MKNSMLAIILGLALLVNFAAGMLYGINKPMQSDAQLFLQIARSVADGDGYKLREGFWPDEPTMSRAPGWPLLVAGALRMERGAWGREQRAGSRGQRAGSKVGDDAVMRVLCLLCNATSALLLGLLTVRLFKSHLAGYLAGLAYAVYPPALYFALTGASEILFIMLLLGGVLLLTGHRRIILGALLLGLAATVRVNIVLFPVAALFVSIVNRSWREKFWINRRPVTLAVIVFFIPILVWTVRNYNVSGEFPVLSTLRGQTLYGGNNEVVASMSKDWGYWIFPNSIPGEKPMRELATHMTELEVDAYYTRRAVEYISSNAASMPLLCIGKIIRAYVPVPWQLSWGLFFVKGCRLLLYVFVAVGIKEAWSRTPAYYKAMLLGFLLVNVAAVVIFWGCSRFAFAIEPLFMPFAAVAVRTVSSGCRNRSIPPTDSAEDPIL